jgi:hypothetical protein
MIDQYWMLFLLDCFVGFVVVVLWLLLQVLL